MTLDVHKRNAIARAYLAGMAPKELAEENHISIPHVIMIAKRHDADRFLAFRARRNAIAEENRLPPAPKRVAERRVVRSEPVARKTRRLGERFTTRSGIKAYVAMEVDGAPISLPYLLMSRTIERDA